VYRVTGWTAPEAGRAEPDPLPGERAGLEQLLDYHRATLVQKCAGLTAEQLKMRPVAPSGLSLLGLVRHMTDVERWWFRMHGAGEDVTVVHDPQELNLDFDATGDADAAADLEAFVRECEAARAAVAAKDLDAVVPSRRPGGADRNVRWLFLHMIAEYARHNGHADLLREVIDGTTGD
jgi:uncharacterized damage-inducible protein DinB